MLGKCALPISSTQGKQRGEEAPGDHLGGEHGGHHDGEDGGHHDGEDGEDGVMIIVVVRLVMVLVQCLQKWCWL